MAKLGVLELQNPRTDCHKIWHGWLRWWYDMACFGMPKYNRLCQWGHSGKWVKCHSCMVLVFMLVRYVLSSCVRLSVCLSQVGVLQRYKD